MYVTFNGINATGFDGRGNYSLGVYIEQIIFPEIDIDKIKKDRRNEYYICNFC